MKDNVLIGQPTSSGNQPITVPDICVLTSFCENVAVACDPSIIEQNDFSEDWLPVLKSVFETKARGKHVLEGSPERHGSTEISLELCSGL